MYFHLEPGRVFLPFRVVPETCGLLLHGIWESPGLCRRWIAGRFVISLKSDTWEEEKIHSERGSAALTVDPFLDSRRKRGREEILQGSLEG